MSSAYISSAYAASFTEWGEPLELTGSKGWLLSRRILGTESRDAMGLYPIFCCENWSRLNQDIEMLRGKYVSVAVVPDIFGEFDEALLRGIFEHTIPFKQHFVVDLRKPANELAHHHHRKHARRALRDARIEVLADPSSALDDWMMLYGTLVARHRLSGIKAFSRAAFDLQLRMPDLVALRATIGDRAVGMQLWFPHKDRVYWHLSAYSDAGYKHRVSYAMNWTANEFFAGKYRWLVLGAGAGSLAGSGGLTDYKLGWATDSRQGYFCGSVLDPARYRELVDRIGRAGTEYFPGYRAGEF